jgi:hypothetical protein
MDTKERVGIRGRNNVADKHGSEQVGKSRKLNDSLGSRCLNAGLLDVLCALCGS